VSFVDADLLGEGERDLEEVGFIKDYKYFLSGFGIADSEELLLAILHLAVVGVSA
jgi:hypothetical protein